MKKLIHKYLSENFFVSDNAIYSLGVPITKLSRYDVLYGIDYDNRIDSNKLAKEVGLIFGFTKKQLKWYFKSWINTVAPSFNVNHYWATPKAQKKVKFKGIHFPMIRRVHSRTISSDLVSVQPMQGPTGQAFYLDYTYGDRGEQTMEPGYVFAPYIPIVETPVIMSDEFHPISGITSRYATKKVNPNFFHQIRIQEETPVGLEIINDLRKETIKKWADSGLLDDLAGVSKKYKKKLFELYEAQAHQTINEI